LQEEIGRQLKLQATASQLVLIRSLCALRLPPEQLIPALLGALHGLIASRNNLFDWTDRRGQLVRYYYEGRIEPTIVRHYFDHFYNRREAEAMPPFSAAVSDSSAVRGAAELNTPEFFRSALYQEIWKPQGLHTRIEAIIRSPRGAPLGSLVLYRGPDDPPFSAHDETLLAAIVPYVARALDCPAAEQVEFALWPSAQEYLLIDDQGRLLQASENAYRMLLLAHDGITPDSAGRSPRREDFAVLKSLYARLSAPHGAVDVAASTVVTNARGRFMFAAQPLAPLKPATERLMHVTMAHFESKALAVHRAISLLPLSEGQRRVCAALYAGRRQPEIALDFGVAPSTIDDHVKKIYTRLDVRSTAQLRELVDAAIFSSGTMASAIR
jgi:DNA-binding CsgD family transcriptional regulator